MDDDGQDHQHPTPGVGIAPSLAAEEDVDAIQGISTALIASRRQMQKIYPGQDSQQRAQKDSRVDQPIFSRLPRYAFYPSHKLSSSKVKLLLSGLEGRNEKGIMKRWSLDEDGRRLGDKKGRTFQRHG